MASGEVIKSYLVSLSADTDMASFTKFEGTMKQTGAFVSNFASGALGDFLKFQVAATGAFASVGFSIVGYLEHLAMADQKQRILAMQNGMAVQQYRSMTSALDVMGISLEDLQRYGTQPMVDQFSTLIHDQERMNAMMPNYEHQMDQVMGVVYQFERLELKLQGFGMLFASDLLKNAGFGDDGIVAQLQRLNDWIMEKMPEWSDELSTDIIPILHEFWGILKDTGSMLGELALGFQHMVGLFSGDESLETQTLSFHSLSKAIEETFAGVARLIHIMLGLEHVAIGVAEAIGGTGKAMIDLKTGNYYGLLSDWDTAKNGVGSIWSTIKGGKEIVSGDGSFAKTASPTSAISGFLDGEGQQAAIAEAQRVSKDTGIPANLILGQWKFETNKFTNRGATQLNNLAGIRYSGSKEYRNFDTIDDFGNYYAALMKSKRYANNGVLAARTPEQFAHSLKAGAYYEDTEKKYAAGIARYSQAPGITVTVNVGPVNNADPDRIAAAVKKGAADAYQLHMANSNGPFGQ